MLDTAQPEFVGNRVIALSLAPGASLPAHIAQRLEAFVTACEGAGIIVSERASCLAVAGPSSVVLGTRQVLTQEGTQSLNAEAILRGLPLKPELHGPATALACEKGRITAWTDRYGVGQLYCHRGDGIAAVSSSATLLAELFGCVPDRQALTGFALTGSFIGAASPFHGIAKVPLGHRMVLDQGRATVEDGPSPLAYRGKPESTLEEVTDAFVAAVRRMHTAFPDAELELSGGLDSRLILAALPGEARRGKRAMTIGPAGSGDAKVARQLAEREGLVHRLVASDGFAALDADGLEVLLERIAAAYDHLANPLDKLAIVSAGMAGGEEPEARFGGQNGEIMRGFYYQAQPIEQPPSGDLARRLITWRLEANDRVNDELLETPGYHEASAAVRAELTATVLSGGESHWWQALDRLYLTQRMPRWVGAGSTNRFIARTNLYPFFDPDFVDAAMRLPGAAKRNSQSAYRMLSRIDPGLALMPLDNGIVPGRVNNQAVGYITNKVNIVTKGFYKVRDRMLHKSKPVLGSSSAIDLWYGLSLSKRLAVKSLNDTGLVNRNAVETLAKSNRRFDRASLGWLLLVESLSRSDKWDCGHGQESR